ncbi:hypothetical protein [Cyclobacterium qasimii]|nr:hypothetical protein [Cyclobacterium qasimii]
MDGKKYRSFTPISGSLRHMMKEYNVYDVIPYRTMLRYDPNFTDKVYIQSTIVQLFWNNQEIIKDYTTLKKLFFNWIIHWKGNEGIMGYSKTEEIIDEFGLKVAGALDLRGYVPLKLKKKHWYSDDVEEVEDSDQRSKLKRALRKESYIKAIREDIRKASKEFQNQFWGIFPTVKNLKERLPYKSTSIRKYGRGNFMASDEQTKSLIVATKKIYPYLTLRRFKNKIESEFGLKYGVSTIKRYWEK